MKIGTTASWLIAFAIPATLAARPDGDRDAKSPERAPEYCKLSDVIGAKVSMSPGSEAVEHAAKEGDTPKRPTGKIDDLLVDSCNGSACWSIITFDKTLGFGGKTVAVPCDQLNWNAGEKRYDLNQSDDQLKALPSFDVAEARKNGFDSCCADMKSYWPSSKVESHKVRDSETTEGENKKTTECPPIMVDGKSLKCALPELVLASDLHGSPVYARGEKFGKIDTTIVDRANHSLSYFVVSHGGTLGVGAAEIIIPIRGICLHQEGKDLAYSVDRAISELATGVQYKKPDHGVLDLELARRADEMFAKDIQKRCEMTHS